MNHAFPYQSRKVKAIAIAQQTADVRRRQFVLVSVVGLAGLVLLLLGSWAM